MIHSIKGKQVKLLATVLGGIFSIAMLVLIFKSGNAETKGVEKYYEKSISTGVDGLSEKEMWIEKSTNELNELKKQNKDLQEQLDKIQKVVVGIGKAMHVWEGVPGNGDNVSGDTVSDAENIKNMDKAISDENFAKPKAEVSQAPTISLMQDFVKTSNQAKPFTEITQDAPKVKPDYDKLRRSRIKTISFSNAGTEYDLDENFIFATTYARCVLLGSVTVSAGVGASSNPQPVLLRLTDAGNLPNNVRGFLKDAVVIGAAYGELSSESVVIRLERIVKIDKNGKIGMDIPVKGYVAGENGDSRIRGVVIDRAGMVVRRAAIGGFLSGVAEFVTRSNTNSNVTFEPNSGLAKFSPQAGSKMLEQGASKGIGNAVEKYADFYIKRAEQLQPVIQIDGGRKLTIVFTESVKASTVNMKKVRKNLLSKNLFKKHLTNHKLRRRK